MKNIVIACDYAYADGGAARIAIDTAIALSQNTNCNIYFIGGSGEPTEDLIASNVNIITLQKYDLLGNPNKYEAFKNGIYNKSIYNELLAFFQHLDISNTILHIHTWTKVLSSAVFQVAEDLGITLCLTAHDYFTVCPNGAFFNFKKSKICKLNPMSAKCVMCDCDSRMYLFKLWRCLRQNRQNKVLTSLSSLNCIFVSEFSRQHLIKLIPNISFEEVINNPVSGYTDSRIKVEDNNVYYFIGRIAKEKGVEIFCEAVKRVNVQAMIIGDGPLKATLEQKYTNIVFTGWLSKQQIQEKLIYARCVVFPSVIYETEGLVVPEVQTKGIPCIVNSICAASENIIDGINGYLFDNIDGLVDAIYKTKDNDSIVQRLSEETYKHFDVSRLSYNVYVDRLMKFYSAIEARNGSKKT